MASVIHEGESLYIPFRDGHSIADSQLKPRMYKTPEAFRKSYPGYYLGTKDVVLTEYTPIVRCKDCDWYDAECESCNFWGGVRHPEHFCGEGERKNNER